MFMEIKQASETGDGPVDAIFKCIKVLYPHDVNLQFIKFMLLLKEQMPSNSKC